MNIPDKYDFDILELLNNTLKVKHLFAALEPKYHRTKYD